MRLVDLEPRWWVSYYFPDENFHDYRGRVGMGVSFLCPVHRGVCAFGRIAIPFANPIDGGPKAHEGQGENKDTWWTRTGDTFEALSLTPSIDVKEEGQPSHWHGFITNGEVT